jgi:hypothetical protein
LKISKGAPFSVRGVRSRAAKTPATISSNLQVVGRNGMHKYNNQDHSMMTASCAVQNILGAKHDLWAINTEPEYHEEKREETAAQKELRRPAYAEPPRIQPVPVRGERGLTRIPASPVLSV